MTKPGQEADFLVAESENVETTMFDVLAAVI